jgi:hypothetical protein
MSLALAAMLPADCAYLLDTFDHPSYVPTSTFHCHSCSQKSTTPRARTHTHTHTHTYTRTHTHTLQDKVGYIQKSAGELAVSGRGMMNTWGLVMDGVCVRVPVLVPMHVSLCVCVCVCWPSGS